MKIPYQGPSMYPYFKTGDLVNCVVYSEPQLVSQLKVGVVYLTKDASEWVLHRCVLVKNKPVLKGDWSPHFHEADALWGECKYSDSLLDGIIARVSVLNINSIKFFRYLSKIILVALGFLSRFNRPG